jgi:flagellar hook protein FlgE
MIPSLHNGVSTLKSVSDGLQVLGNNIANVGSLGYKSARANYSDNFYIHVNKAISGGDGGAKNTVKSAGTGVHVGSISTDFNQGVLENTGLDLDLAIQGEALPNGGGFFEVFDPISGQLFYTRAGAFEATSEGKLVTRDSFRYELRGIDDENIRIGLDEGESLLARRIEDDGKIRLVVSKNGEDSLRDSGQLKIVNFMSPQYLRRAGNGYYSNSTGEASMIDNSIPASGSNGKVKQFSLEISNVDLTNEFAMMITHQRSFQAGSRVVTTSDSILSEAVNLKR